MIASIAAGESRIRELEAQRTEAALDLLYSRRSLGDCRAAYERLRAERDALKAELASWMDIADKRMEAGLRVQGSLAELREAAEAVNQLGPECECGECEWCGLDHVLAKAKASK